MIFAPYLFTVSICSLGCLCIAYLQIKEWLTWRALKKNGQTVHAVITELNPVLKRGAYVYVSYRFEDDNKKSHVGRRWVAITEYKGLSPGFYITVRYLRNKPHISMVENDPGRWGRTFSGIVVFCILAFILLRTIGY
jgi:hypothetical protein